MVGLLRPVEVALQLDADVVAAEEADQAIEQAADAVLPAPECLAADQRHQPGGAAVELVERERPLALRRPQLHAGDQAAEVAVTLG